MRTTLDIDDTVLAAARALASSSRTSLGAAVSELARRGLRASASHNGPATEPTTTVTWSPFPVVATPTGHLVTDELIAALRDE